jgi:hemerythrin-like domain-containing protein
MEERDMTVDTAPHRSAMDGFVLVHRTLIDGGHRLTEVLQRPSNGRELPGLARLWSFYRAGLTDHHEGESEVVFPLVTERDPAFAALEASMAHEHDDIDARLSVADAAMGAAMVDATSASRRAAAEALDALVSSLEGHLEREERLVLPRVVAAISPDEMAEIELGFVRRAGARRLALTVAALDQTARRERLPMPPLPIPARLLLPLWRGRYRRLLAGAGIEAPGGAW